MRRMMSAALAAAVLAGGALVATTASAQILGGQVYVGAPGVYVDGRVRAGDGRYYYRDGRRYYRDDRGRHNGWRKHKRDRYAYYAPSRCRTVLEWDTYRGRYVNRTRCW